MLCGGGLGCWEEGREELRALRGGFRGEGGLVLVSLVEYTLSLVFNCAWLNVRLRSRF